MTVKAQSTQLVANVPANFHKDRTKEYAAKDAAGMPWSTCSSYQITTVFRDNEKRLFELWTQDTSGGKGDLTKAADAAEADGDPSIYLNTKTELPIVLYRGSDAHIHGIYWVPGGAGHDRLSELAQAATAAKESVPIGYYVPDGEHSRVVYRAEDNHLHLIYWVRDDPVQYDGDALTTLAEDASTAAGNPTAYYDPINRLNSVIYRGLADNNIHRIFWVNGTQHYQYQNLSALSVTPTLEAAGDPAAYFDAASELNQVFYRTQDGEICELSWKAGSPPEFRNYMTEFEPPETAASDPVAYSSGKIKNAVYLDTSGHVQKITRWAEPFQSPKWSTDLTKAVPATPARGKPTAFFGAPDNHHVLFLGANDNHIHELVWKEVEVPF